MTDRGSARLLRDGARRRILPAGRRITRYRTPAAAIGAQPLEHRSCPDRQLRAAHHYTALRSCCSQGPRAWRCSCFGQKRGIAAVTLGTRDAGLFVHRQRAESSATRIVRQPGPRRRHADSSWRGCRCTRCSPPEPDVFSQRPHRETPSAASAIAPRTGSPGDPANQTRSSRDAAMSFTPSPSP